MHAFGLPDTPDAHQFVSDVYARAPRKNKRKDTSDAARKQAEKDAKALRSQKYSFVEDDDGTESSTTLSKKEKGKSNGKESRSKAKGERERHVRKRETDGRDWESDEEGEIARKRLRGEMDVPRRGESDARTRCPLPVAPAEA